MKAISIFISLAIIAISAYAQKSFSPQSEALKQLNRLKPALQKKYGGVMDEPKAIVGDINGDNRPDCILTYIITPNDGGNMILAHVSTIFLNTGRGVKNAGNIPDFKFCYTPQLIDKGFIIVKKYTCVPPYNDDLGTAKLVYRGGQVQAVR